MMEEAVLERKPFFRLFAAALAGYVRSRVSII